MRSFIGTCGADAHIQLVKGDEQAFANEIIRQVETYGFDGLTST